MSEEFPEPGADDLTAMDDDDDDEDFLSEDDDDDELDLDDEPDLGE